MLDEPDRIRSKVERLAREWAEEHHTGEGDAAIKRMRKAWAASEALKGDGAIGTPTLRESADGGLEWSIPITGPEPLAALAYWVAGTIGPGGLADEINRWRNVLFTLDREMEWGDHTTWEDGDGALQRARARDAKRIFAPAHARRGGGV